MLNALVWHITKWYMFKSIKTFRSTQKSNDRACPQPLKAAAGLLLWTWDQAAAPGVGAPGLHRIAWRRALWRRTLHAVLNVSSALGSHL